MAQYKNVDGITVFGELSDRAAQDIAANSDVFAQIRESLAGIEGAKGALSADNHLGYRMPIGGVAAYPRHISPTGVGFDIGCGNNAVQISLTADDIRDDLAGLVAEISRAVRFGLGSTGSGQDHPLFDDPAWKSPLASGLKDLARQQLGSVGGGNHFVDLLVDESGYIWIANHFGSRGFGHTIAKNVMKQLGIKDATFGPPALLEEGTPLFDDYLAAMQLAGAYAYAGREIVINQVMHILGIFAPVKSVMNHHNYAWREEIDGSKCWVIRKGATPLRPGQESFIGGSMGDISVIVRGLDSTVAQMALYSAPHGAGRIISRRQAKQTITRDEMKARLKKEGVHVVGGDVDESPMAYRPLHGVLDAHEGGFEIVHVLKPVGVVMAGAGEIDPYKD